MKNTIWEAYGKSDVGKKRSINQDAFLVQTEYKLWLVADGMGGHKDGDLASSAIIDSLMSFRPQKTLGTTVSEIYNKLRQVNQSLYQLSINDKLNQIVGSTVAILLAYKQFFIAIWSGDSRIYLFRKDRLTQITYDHNYESLLLQTGISPELVKSHPFANSLTHAVGSDEEFFIESQLHECRINDIFLICSDGLNKEITDKEIELILQTKSISEAVDNLMDICLNRGARDNVTIILVRLVGES